MPIITISRGTLSGGRAVAECLADRLGYPCVGREVLQEAAARLGASEETVRAKLQVPPGPWALLTEERYRYVVAVQSALAECCLQGDVVYHGLAGQLLLRGLRGVIRVRLIAPVEQRVQALLTQHPGTSAPAALRFIRTVDRQRRRWVQRMYGVDVADTALYDATINLQGLSLDTVCTTLAELARQPEYRITDAVRAEHEAFAEHCRRRLDAALATPE